MVGVAGRSVESLVPEPFEKRDKSSLSLEVGDKVQIGRSSTQAVRMKSECTNDCVGDLLALEELRYGSHDSRKVQAGLLLTSIMHSWEENT